MPRVREVYLGAARIMAEALLALDDVRAGYGDAVVLDGISFEVPDGGSLALLGRNGVGKSTLLLTIMGFTRVSRGTIALARARHHARCRRIGARATGSAGWRRSARYFPLSASRRTSRWPPRPGRWTLEAVYSLFPRLEERRASRGNHLSGGEQQMLAIARALMTNPALLLLDEPLEGLAPIIVEELTAAIRRMTADEGTAFILVEQHAEVALSLTEDAVVLERGSIVHRARSRDLLRDQDTLDRLIGLRLDDAGDSSSRHWRHSPALKTLKLLCDEFQDLGTLAVEIVRRRRVVLLLGLRLYGPRNGFVDESPNCFVAGQ